VVAIGLALLHQLINNGTQFANCTGGRLRAALLVTQLRHVNLKRQRLCSSDQHLDVRGARRKTGDQFC
jgi:hypothetical protein